MINFIVAIFVLRRKMYLEEEVLLLTAEPEKLI